MNRLATYSFPVALFATGYILSLMMKASIYIGVLGYMIIGVGFLHIGMCIIYDLVGSLLACFKTNVSKKYAVTFLYIVLFVCLAIILINKNYLIHKLVDLLSLI